MYDLKNDLTTQNVYNEGGIEISYQYSYDDEGRLSETKTQTPTAAKTKGGYFYNAADELLQEKHYKPNEQVLLTLNRSYDTQRPWLTGISEVTGSRFSETLAYNKSGERLNVRNGNIFQQGISQNASAGWPALSWNYDYDILSRLISAVSTSNSSYTSTYQYDADGNFTRKKWGNTDFQYSYIANSNKASYIENQTDASNMFLSYDTKGNVTKKEKENGYKVEIMRMDNRNLALEVKSRASLSPYVLTVYYKYDDNGNRIAKRFADPEADINEYYLRDHTGRELAVYDANTGRAKMFNIYGNGLEGRIDVSWNYVPVQDECGSGTTTLRRTDTRAYYIKDHLGSIRQTVKEDGTLLTAQDYYPYGETIREYVNSFGTDRYRFTGKERDVETNFDYFGARYYDSELGIWHSVDPMRDKYAGFSPYGYCMDNPMMFIDPKGEEVWFSGIYEKDKDDKYKNPALVEAFEKFAKSKEGVAFLSQFAHKGQTIAGIEYSTSGKFDKTGLNLAFDRSENLKGGIRGETHIDNQDIHIRTSTELTNSNNIYNIVQNLVHESFIHGQLFAEDYMDDRNMNYSNVPTPLSSLWNSHHPYANNNGNSYFLKNGFPLLYKMNEIYKVHKNAQEVGDAMRNFRY